MIAKDIKLSPKKNGLGYVSSYSVNLALTEVKECFLDSSGNPLQLEKVIDPANKQIIIRVKAD